MTRCLPTLPNITCYLLHLRLRIVEWTQNSALSLRFVWVWGRWSCFLHLLDVLSDFSYSVSMILLSLLLLVVFATLLYPISRCIVALRTWHSVLLFRKNFSQLVMSRKKPIWEETDVVELFFHLGAKEFSFSPIMLWHSVSRVIHLKFLEQIIVNAYLFDWYIVGKSIVPLRHWGSLQGECRSSDLQITALSRAIILHPIANNTSL